MDGFAQDTKDVSKKDNRGSFPRFFFLAFLPFQRTEESNQVVFYSSSFSFWKKKRKRKEKLHIVMDGLRRAPKRSVKKMTAVLSRGFSFSLFYLSNRREKAIGFW